jgi:hypothetical protein
MLPFHLPVSICLRVWHWMLARRVASFLPGAKLLDGGPSDRQMIRMLKWHPPSDGFDEVGAH